MRMEVCDRDLRVQPDVPVIVIIAAKPYPPPGMPFDPETHFTRIFHRVQKLQEWALASGRGTVVVTNHTSHVVPKEDPCLIVWAINRVLAALRERTATVPMFLTTRGNISPGGAALIAHRSTDKRQTKSPERIDQRETNGSEPIWLDGDFQTRARAQASSFRLKVGSSVQRASLRFTRVEAWPRLFNPKAVAISPSRACPAFHAR